jgi:hypothetical protein
VSRLRCRVFMSSIIRGRSSTTAWVLSLVPVMNEVDETSIQTAGALSPLSLCSLMIVLPAGTVCLPINAVAPSCRRRDGNYQVIPSFELDGKYTLRDIGDYPACGARPSAQKRGEVRIVAFADWANPGGFGGGEEAVAKPATLL